MKTKFFKSLLAGTAVALTLFSCGNKSKAPAADMAKTNQPVTIKYWAFPNFTGDKEFKTPEEFDKALIKAFEAKHPNIKVDYQKIDFTDGPAKIETAIQASSAPDIVIDAPGRIISWAKSGYLLPFNGVDTSKFSKALVNASSYDGKLYLDPIGAQPFLMAVNMNLAKKLGIEKMLPLNKPGRNWTPEEFMKVLEVIKKKDPKIYPVLFYTKSQAGDQGPRAFISNLYNSWITNPEVTKYTINDANGVKGLEWLKKAYDQKLLGNSVSAEAKDALEAFKTGNAVFTIIYSNGLKASQAKEIADGKIDPVFLAFPNESGQAKYEFLVAGPCIFDNNNPARAKAAREFVDFMTSDPVWGPRVLKASKNFSPDKNVKGLYDDEESKFLESLTPYYGPYYNTIDGYKQMRPLWFNMVQGVLNGQQTPKQGLDNFVKQADQTIKDAK